MVGALVVGALLVFAWLAREDDDPCLSAGSQHRQMHPQNPYLSACEGRLYLPDPNAGRPYVRIDDFKLSDVEPLPFRYLKASGRVYFVAVFASDYDSDKYALLPIEGIDGETAVPLDADHIQDKENKFTIMYDTDVSIQRRIDR